MARRANAGGTCATLAPCAHCAAQHRISGRVGAIFHGWRRGTGDEGGRSRHGAHIITAPFNIAAAEGRRRRRIVIRSDASCARLIRISVTRRKDGAMKLSVASGFGAVSNVDNVHFCWAALPAGMKMAVTTASEDAAATLF